MPEPRSTGHRGSRRQPDRRWPRPSRPSPVATEGVPTSAHLAPSPTRWAPEHLHVPMCLRGSPGRGGRGQVRDHVAAVARPDHVVVRRGRALDRGATPRAGRGGRPRAALGRAPCCSRRSRDAVARCTTGGRSPGAGAIEHLEGRPRPAARRHRRGGPMPDRLDVSEHERWRDPAVAQVYRLVQEPMGSAARSSPLAAAEAARTVRLRMSGSSCGHQRPRDTHRVCTLPAWRLNRCC